MWFYDGSVECYKGAHLALMIVACVWLVLAALLVPFLAVVSYQSEINNKVFKPSFQCLIAIVINTHSFFCFFVFVFLPFSSKTFLVDTLTSVQRSWLSLTRRTANGGPLTSS